MTDQHETRADTGPELDLVAHPRTGELVTLASPAADLVDVLDEVARQRERLAELEQAIADELAHRADRIGARKVELDGVEVEVNAPTEDVYLVDVLRERLEELVACGLIDRALIRSLIVYPQPRPVEPRVDKRRAAVLLRSDNAELVAALEAARRRQPTTRKAKVLRRAIPGTATEAPR